MNFFKQAEIGPVINEKSEQVKNIIESFDRLYYAQGKVTHRSRFARNSQDKEGRERPLFSRADRAELFKKFKKQPEGSSARENIIAEANLRDEINEQYLNQREVTVSSEYGPQKARISDINPPESLQTPETKKQPPIFLIPGISNDIECVSALITEVAYQGRRIITAGYPESFMGQTTEEFAAAVEKDSGLTPHIEFFKTVIDKFFDKDQDIELWGLSTGAPIVSGILTDKTYQEKTKDAVLLFPAASVEQKLSSFNLGVMHDLGFMKDNSSASLNFTVDSKIPKAKEQMELRKKIMGSLTKKIIKADQNWRTALVQEGGNIIVVSGGNDRITKSAQMSEEFLKGNSAMRVLDLPTAYHSTPQIEPELVVSKLFELEQKLKKE
ncbi:MAG: hypothetical protein NTY31_03895 [Candidatus Falkowbacteria bacterium]|nr:hypothetical protein [Candidatus Falkowbacteria bacterium]